MASSPSPHCSLTTPKPQPKPKSKHNHHPIQNRLRTLHCSENAPAPITLPSFSTSASSAFSHHHHHQQHAPLLAPAKSPKCPYPYPYLTPEFSGRRPTRLVSKVSSTRFRPAQASPSSRLPSAAAEHVLAQSTLPGSDLDSVLSAYGPHLQPPDDYTYLLRQFSAVSRPDLSLRLFHLALLRRPHLLPSHQAKLASAAISSLGRSARPDLALQVFDHASAAGFGRTVYAFSALISAFARCGLADDAIRTFHSMRDSGLKPNLVTFNALIDACAKGGVDFSRALSFFHDMARSGVAPDRITFNSLLAVCSRSGLWEAARDLFRDMADRGIDCDIFSYNTLLDALCKAGEMDLALHFMSDMPKRNVAPTVVTYSTMIDGYSKIGKYQEALRLFDEMKLLGIPLDRISYNTLVAIYAKLGRFEDALSVCQQMENSGIGKDVVTYNALLDGYGKLGKFNGVKYFFKDMKHEGVSPNVLTYSTLIDVYIKGGLYKEAMEMFREFKQKGLKADVVLYSSLIDSLCKNGLVESAVWLLDEMARDGIWPNVVTYNSIIDAFGRVRQPPVQEVAGKDEERHELPNSVISEGEVGDVEGDKQIMKIFGQLALEKEPPAAGEAKREAQEIMCILGLFHQMHELEIRPNVVTFSAILNACSRCNSFECASMLLDELRHFDNQVYGVAHGLLMGRCDNIWAQAQSLFDDVKRMDTPTASAFYNALTDMLWHFGQRHGAQLVVLEGKRRQVWDNAWGDSCLDLHLMSTGAAQAMVHAWLLNIRSVVFKGQELPKLLSILTGWGKHSKVTGDGTLRRAVEALLTGIGAPFRMAKFNIGRFISSGSVVATWLKDTGTLSFLILHDDRRNSESELDGLSGLQVIPL